jgi:flagellar biosynthesis protein FlhF
LKLKSFYADTVAQAIAKARAELGADAMIVASRRTENRGSEAGVYEIVCGIQEEEPSASTVNRAAASAASTAPAAPAPPMTAASPAKTPKPAKSEKQRIRQSISRMKKAVEPWKPRPIETALEPVPAPEFSKAERTLVQAGFSDDLVLEIMAGVKQRFRQRSSAPRTLASSSVDGTDPVVDPLESCVAEELAARISVEPTLGRPRSERRVVALIGPPGVGKTTTLVKLAVKYGLTARKRLHLITLDTYRIAKAEQLCTYAAAMGASIDTVETVASLSQALEENSAKGLVLIDTAGLGPAEISGSSQLASFFSRNSEIDVHLTLPAYMSAADMAAASERFRAYLPSKLLFTNVDAAGSTGALVATSLQLEKPVSFLCNGQEIPEDIADATTESLLSQWLPGQKRAKASAA